MKMPIEVDTSFNYAITQITTAALNIRFRNIIFQRQNVFQHMSQLVKISITAISFKIYVVHTFRKQKLEHVTI